MAASNVVVRPVILSRPENTARPIVDMRRRRLDHRVVLRRGGSRGGRGWRRIRGRGRSRATLCRWGWHQRALRGLPGRGWRPKRRAVAATAGLRPAARPPDTEAGSDKPASLGWDKLASLGWDKLDRVADTAAADPVADRAAGTAAALAADRAAGQVAAGPVPGSYQRAAAAPETDRLARLLAVAAAVRRQRCRRIGLLPARQRKFRRSKAARRRSGLWTAGNMGAMGSTASLGCEPG